MQIRWSFWAKIKFPTWFYKEVLFYPPFDDSDWIDWIVAVDQGYKVDIVAVDQGYKVGIAYLDFSKAFD